MFKEINYDENLSIKTQLLNIRNYPIHNHKDFQIFYVLEGELSLKIFYAKYRLQPGSIHIVHSEDVHSIKSITDNNLVLVLSFDSEYFQSIFPHFITTVFITNIEEQSFKKSTLLIEQIFAIVAEEHEKSVGYKTRINNSAVALINTLMNHFRGFVIDPNKKAFIHKTSRDYMQVDRISRVIQYVYENYPYKLSLQEIAERERINPYYLSHVFHNLVGVNFRDFLSMVRVEMSEPAVLFTSKSITQISQDVGFSDAKYYVSRFYDHMGCHPKEYRKKFAEKIYGVAKPDIEEYPLSKLKPIIGKYTQYPVFKEKFNKIAHIELDFDAKSVGNLPAFNDVFNHIDHIFIDLKNKQNTFKDMSKWYEESSPQQFAIEILQNLTAGPENFSFPSINLFDTATRNNGVFTTTGLKKPVYYLLSILSSVPKEIISYGPNYIVLQENKNKYLLVFNCDNERDITFDIVTRNVKSNYKLIKYKLISQNSCINFWEQLNFTCNLTTEDIENINYMSKPDVEFEMLPQYEQYYTSINLAPHDIILLKFTNEKLVQ